MTSVSKNVYPLMCLAIVLFLSSLRTSFSSPSVEYRVLWRWQNTEPDSFRIMRYDITVESALGRSDFKELICQFLRKENPQHYETLMINVYYDLGEFVPDLGSPSQRKKNLHHFIGSYTWNALWASKRGGGSLYLVKDKLGNELSDPEQSRFDHMTLCDK